MNSETRPQRFVAVEAARPPIDPRAEYDGQMFLADRKVDHEHLKRHVTDPVVIHSDQGLVTQTKPMITSSSPFFQPTMPYGLTHPNLTFSNHAQPF